MAKPVDSACSTFQTAIEVLGRPWTALILNALQRGPLRFSEIGGLGKRPGDKVLSARLKELLQRGLVVRRVEGGPPVRVAYELTASGRAFGAVAEAIERWGRELAMPAAGPKAARRRSA